VLKFVNYFCILKKDFIFATVDLVFTILNYKDKAIMKKCMLLFCLVALSSVQSYGQSIYETVYRGALAKVNSASSSDATIDINQFEVTALNYLYLQVEKRDLEMGDYFYDNQAVNLKSFVDDFLYYLETARTMSTDKRKAVIDCFRNASLKNEMFGDLNRERSLCYVNDVNTYTPFSLDTNWEKAYSQAMKDIKEVLK